MAIRCAFPFGTQAALCYKILTFYLYTSLVLSTFPPNYSNAIETDSIPIPVVKRYLKRPRVHASYLVEAFLIGLMSDLRESSRSSDNEHPESWDRPAALIGDSPLKAPSLVADDDGVPLVPQPTATSIMTARTAVRPFFQLITTSRRFDLPVMRAT